MNLFMQCTTKKKAIKNPEQKVNNSYSIGESQLCIKDIHSVRFKSFSFAKKSLILKAKEDDPARRTKSTPYKLTA